MQEQSIAERGPAKKEVAPSNFDPIHEESEGEDKVGLKFSLILAVGLGGGRHVF